MSNNYIHSESIIGKNTIVEPYSYIDADVEIGNNCWIGNNVTIYSGARIGDNVRIFPGAVISSIPQDLKFGGEKTTVNIGNNTMTTADLNFNSDTIDISGGPLNITDEFDMDNGTFTQTGGTVNVRYSTGANGNGDAKFDVDAGTLNLTAGSLNINGEHTGTADFEHSIHFASGITVNANANHTIGIIDNTSGSSLEHRYVDFGGKSIGSLTFNVTTKDLFLKSNTTLLGNLTVTAGEFRPQAYNVDISGSVDIDDEIEISTGTINVDGAFDATGGIIDFTDAGRITLAGTVTSLGTLDEAAGTIEYDGGTQDVLADAYYNLEIDQAGTKTAQGTITVAGGLTVQNNGLVIYDIAGTNTTVTGTSTTNYTDASNNGTIKLSTGTFTANGTSDINGRLTINGSGVYDADNTFDATGGTVEFTGTGGTLKLGGATVSSIGNTFTHGTGTVEYDYAGNQTVKSRNYYNLEIDGTSTSHVKSVANDFTIDNNLTVSSTSAFDALARTISVTGASDVNGILNIDGSGIIDANGAFDATSGTITMDGTARLQLAGTVTNLGTLDELAGTVEYDGGTQDVLADAYYNLEIDQSGVKSQASGTMTVAGTMTVQSAATYALDTRDITVSGTTTSPGTTRISTGTYTASGATDFSIGTLSNVTADFPVPINSFM